MFLNTQNVNNQRIYGVQLYSLGIPLTVVVDDFIPFKKYSPAYANIADNNGLWPIILEKAFAKLHGTYHAIEESNTISAI